MSGGTSDRVSSTQENMASLKPHAQIHLLSPVDKCKVCGEPAAKHIHYGAMSCFSCRAFFRRSIQNKTANTYVCRRNKDCQINLKTRKNCQFCRYERCLSVGMKPSWVLSPDERERRFRKNKEKKEAKYESVESCDISRPYTNNIKQEFPTSLLASQEVKSEVLLYAETDTQVCGAVSPGGHSSPPQASHSQACQPLAVKGCVDVPHVKEMLPRTSNSLISPFQHQNLFVYSPSSQNLAAATPVISAREDVARAIIVSCGDQFSATSSPHSFSALPSRLSISSPVASSPPVFPRSVIVKSQYFVEAPTAPTPTPTPTTHQSGQSVCCTPISNNITDTTPWHTPSYTHTNHDTQINTAHRDRVTVSPFLPTTTIRSPHTGMSEESEYEDSVYSRSSDDERSIQGFPSEPEIKFTEEEYENLRGLVRSHDERYRSVNFGEELIKEMIMCSMFGIPISTSAAISGYRLTVERITRIANHLGCFADLPMMDQSSLLKENADLLVSLRGAIFFDSKKKGVNQVLISMGIDDLETIKTMFSPLMKESRMKHIDYKIFNSIQKVESNNSVEQRYNFLQGKVAESISDEITTILLTYIILFSVDFCTLQDSRRVEQLQEQFIRMLERYVYSKTGRKDACNTLANVLNAVTCIREMADIKKSRAINHAVKIN